MYSIDSDGGDHFISPPSRLVVMRAMIDWYSAIQFAQLSELYSVITYGHGDHSAGSTALATARAISGHKNLDAASITIRVFSITF